MSRFRKHALAATFSLFALGATHSLAEGLPQDGPLSDGKISEDELGVVILSAQQQLIRLSEAATKEYQSAILEPGANTPKAWMLMKDGETVKRINIDAQAVGMPAVAQLKMYRAAIKSIAQRGQINAAAILYTGRVSEGNETEVLVIEHEHRLGVSSNKVIGYEIRNGAISWAEPVSQEKPFEWFYEGKGGKS
ncbi:MULTISPECIES: hypothetical protein [Marinobacter]|jgi:hypothetical protein|uniref:DUF1318 domain-containing protein n=2 Tax=Marinobacter TaxID=2742 RepID=A0A455WB43_MARNT|nr:MULTISPECIES: hypothetical protein [Marinobacter]WBU43093.1 hypothetical protein PBN92_09485 [Marinobacter alkaliphilus]BBJ03915.1 hypothetical protein YBY_17640 [Marinobacter nauticus]MCD1630036.1 hypothetical protein [Marinobacter shengliensis]QFS86985.1 hypothetical protein FIV08_09095 [Marinobacter sp. THAF197a]QFT50769.1 hypothetical protein FIU96_09015 [Marinobacter sp. THAF39]